MSGEDNKAVFRRAIDEGYNKGNLAAIDELFSPNFTHHQDAIWPRTTEGVKDFIKYVRAAFPDLKLTIEEIIAVGDKTWARTTAHGTHKGIFMGLPPTGKEFTVNRLDVCRFDGGKIVEHWGVMDRLGVLQRLGARIQPSQ